MTAPLVYVNYGVAEDDEVLQKLGIDVRGKIVIARYGRTWRGIKPKLAQENGAVGCLIYSDPRDDGYFQGDIYPNGPMRPPQGAQRGSVMDMAIYPGDPLTPGWASVAGAKRIPRAEAKTILKIPVMPISYGDAQPLLEQLHGPMVPEAWRGALPITYHTGPGPAVVHLKLDFDWTNKPVNDVIATISYGDAQPLLEQLHGPVVPESWRGALPITYHTGPGPAVVHLKLDFDWTNKPVNDVIAQIPGGVYKDQWIMYGNHHDAWVNGASDPISGAAALTRRAARTLGRDAQKRDGSRSGPSASRCGMAKSSVWSVPPSGWRSIRKKSSARPRFISTPIQTAAARSARAGRTRSRCSCGKCCVT